MPDIKPSKVQLQILKKLSEGWEIRTGETSSRHITLNKAECDTEVVNTNTFGALYSNKWIKTIQYGFPTTIYAISAEGRVALAKHAPKKGIDDAERKQDVPPEGILAKQEDGARGDGGDEEKVPAQ